MWSSVSASGQQPSRLTASCVGLNPTMPQHAAGDTDRAAGIGAHADRRQARGDRRARAAARATRNVSRCGGILDEAEMHVGAGHAVCELMQIGGADDQCTGLAQFAYGYGVALRLLAIHRARAASERMAAHMHQILHRDRHTGEHSKRLAFGETRVESLRIFQHLLRAQRDKCVEVLLLFSFRQHRLSDFDYGNVFGRNALRDLTGTCRSQRIAAPIRRSRCSLRLHLELSSRWQRQHVDAGRCFVQRLQIRDMHGEALFPECGALEERVLSSMRGCDEELGKRGRVGHLYDRSRLFGRSVKK